MAEFNYGMTKKSFRQQAKIYHPDEKDVPEFVRKRMKKYEIPQVFQDELERLVRKELGYGD